MTGISLSMTTWEKEIAQWVAYMRATGTPETTIVVRRNHLGQLARHTTKPPHGITFDDLVEWMAGRAWSQNTRRSVRTSLRAFWRWRMTTGKAKSSPAHEIPPIRIPRMRPRPAPESAYRQALANAPDARVRRAIVLAGGCGLRRGEIARAHTRDIEPDAFGYSLRVTGKGGHVRSVPLPDDLADDLLSLPEGWIFPSSHGAHITPHHLGKLITAQLPGDLTTHTLRHRAATVAYAGSRDLRAVQELLGHSKPETTSQYTAVPDHAVRAAMLAAAA